ncbi:MAG: lysylphosphatidylglycerol synthase domain-containing protein, partial [Myxococcota bacterium]
MTISQTAHPPAPLRQLARRGLYGALGILATIGLVLLAAASTDLTGDAVQAIWARSDPRYFVLAVALMTTGLVFLALRWRAMMTHREGVTIVPLTSLFTIGTLLNYALPGPVGEFASAALAGRRFGIAPEMAFAAAIHARFIGLSVAGVAAGVAFLVTDLPVPEGVHRGMGVAVAAITVGALALGGLSAWPQGLRAIAGATVGRFRVLSGLHASVVRLADALGSVGRLGPARYAVGAFWALCGHACVVGGVAVAA